MIDGRYSLDREIGRGGMGAVWLGRDEVLGRPVAIKRIGMGQGNSGLDPSRAEREARIAASLNHPNIVGVYDLVNEDDQLWLVMEYVEGTTLSELIRSQGALPHLQVAELITQVASALASAHANGVIHRDVKPSNILVREDGQVKLSDFGIARAEADLALTQTGLVSGSPAYLAPEVAMGMAATAASDVWSLGATLFHALAGSPPYDASDNVLGALYRIVNEPPPQLDDAGDLAPLLEATMAHDPHRRWSMDDVARFLANLAEPTPPNTDEETRTLVATMPNPPPLPPPVRDARRPRRLPLLPSLVGLLVAALMVAIIFLALLDDPQDSTTGNDGLGGSSSTTPSDSSTASSDPAGATATEAELRSFVEEYVSTASLDPEAGFQRLTASYQNASPGYADFWGNVRNPTVEDFSADLDSLVVTYTYRYILQGKGPKTETVSLQLVDDGDDGFLIAGLAS